MRCKKFHDYEEDNLDIQVGLNLIMGAISGISEKIKNIENKINEIEVVMSQKPKFQEFPNNSDSLNSRLNMISEQLDTIKGSIHTQGIPLSTTFSNFRGKWSTTQNTNPKGNKTKSSLNERSIDLYEKIPAKGAKSMMNKKVSGKEAENRTIRNDSHESDSDNTSKNSGGSFIKELVSVQIESQSGTSESPELSGERFQKPFMNMELAPPLSPTGSCEHMETENPPEHQGMTDNDYSDDNRKIFTQKTPAIESFKKDDELDIH